MNKAFDIEELLRNNLLEKSKETPVGLFQEIENRLLQKKKRRRIFWILFWIGLGIGAYLMGVYITNVYITKCECPATNTIASPLKNALNVDRNTSHGTTCFFPISISNKTNQQYSNYRYETPNCIDSCSTFNKSTINQSNNPTIESPKLLSSNRTNKVIIPLEVELMAMNVIAKKQVSYLKKQPNKVNMPVGKSIERIKKNKLSIGSINEIQNEPVSEEISKHRTAEQDSLSKKGTTINSDTPTKKLPFIAKNTETPQSKKYGITVYGGPSFFDVSVFKPYLSSGSLSNRPFNSDGYELGIRSLKNIKKRWDINLSMAFNHKHSQFTYDLLVNEEDYFNYYNNDELISTEQLDIQEDCNCFVAKEVQLEYDINTVKISLGTNYQIYKLNKFNIYGSFNLSTNAITQFKNNRSSVVDFPAQLSEKFNNIGLEIGLSFGFELSTNTRLTLLPNYNFQFTRPGSSFYARPLKELTIPLGITFFL